MLRVYHQPASGNERRLARDMQLNFINYNGPLLTTYEGLDAIQYAMDNRLVRQSAVVVRSVSASWTGKKSFHLMLQSA